MSCQKLDDVEISKCTGSAGLDEDYMVYNFEEIPKNEQKYIIKATDTVGGESFCLDIRRVVADIARGDTEYSDYDKKKI